MIYIAHIMDPPIVHSNYSDLEDIDHIWTSVNEDIGEMVQAYERRQDHQHTHSHDFVDVGPELFFGSESMQSSRTIDVLDWMHLLDGEDFGERVITEPENWDSSPRSSPTIGESTSRRNTLVVISDHEDQDNQQLATSDPAPLTVPMQNIKKNKKPKLDASQVNDSVSNPSQEIKTTKKGKPTVLQRSNVLRAEERTQYRGVTYLKNVKDKPYRARLSHGKAISHVGYYSTPEEAAEAWDDEVVAKGLANERKLNFPARQPSV